MGKIVAKGNDGKKSAYKHGPSGYVSIKNVKGVKFTVREKSSVAGRFISHSAYSSVKVRKKVSAYTADEAQWLNSFARSAAKAGNEST
ncbi:MAG: hypothetical protein L0Z50_09745 [Verrucomicrobiales bacterium]|nr:hypothetical protein [Verrucomicrobiales bacterium]